METTSNGKPAFWLKLFPDGEGLCLFVLFSVFWNHQEMDIFPGHNTLLTKERIAVTRDITADV